MKKFAFINGLIFLFFSVSSKNKVTLETLLHEMTVRHNHTYLSDKPYSIKMFSSYDRESISTEDEGWWANDDRSHFLREEINSNRREFVLFDTKGPGAVVRWWMTFGIRNASESGTIRIYIDNEKEPVIEGNILKILSGDDLTTEPFAVSVPSEIKYENRGHNLYLPLPYSKQCKITYESENLQLKNDVLRPAIYYNIEYRTYKKGIKVESVSRELINKNRKIIEATGHKLMENISEHRHNVLDDRQKLSPGESMTLHFDDVGNAVSYLSVQVDSENLSQSLRSLVLSISFDGNQTVWMPVGDFFGTGYLVSPSKTWYTSVKKNGKMESYWIMPFQEQADIKYTNYGEEEVVVDVLVGFEKYKWTNKSMYFGAAWHELYQINTATDPDLKNHKWHFDVNYVDLKGRGVYMGDGVTLFNTADRKDKSNWWGEGDEKIFVDGEEFPSLFGTGTEDYYGYAKCRPEEFSHPFMSQPLGSGNLQPGITVNRRYRNLDAIPFSNEISVNIEIWHWAKTIINYAMSSFWYALPGFDSNIQPSIESVKKPVALKRSDVYKNE